MEYPAVLFQPVVGTGVVMDATGERLGTVYCVTKAGDIAKVLFYNAAVTSGDTIKASIQTVGADGLPTGTVWATATGNKAYGTVAISTSDTGWHTVTFTEVAPVVAGDIIAIVFEWNSYSSGNMRFYTNACIATVPGGSIRFPYMVTDITASPGTWVIAPYYGSGGLAITLEYDGGNYYNNFNADGLACTSTFALGTGSTPDEVGNYFQVPFTMRAYGFCLYIDLDYAVTVSLLDSSNTVLANRELDPDWRCGTAAGPHFFPFDPDPAALVTLQPSTWYRLIITPSSSNTVAAYYLDVPSAAAMATLDGGALCYATSRDNGGAWTNLGTRRWAVYLLIDQIDIPSGGGGGGGLPILGGSIVR